MREEKIVEPMHTADRHNIMDTKYPKRSTLPAQKLTSEENLLVGVESVDDEGEELVDISREGVAFSVGGLLAAEGRGIRKMCGGLRTKQARVR